MKFQIGDRVVCTVAGGGDQYSYPELGMCGVIVAIDEYFERSPYGVRFDEGFTGGHGLIFNGVNYCDKPHGWWCSETALEFEDDNSEYEISNIDLNEVL